MVSKMCYRSIVTRGRSVDSTGGVCVLLYWSRLSGRQEMCESSKDDGSAKSQRCGSQAYQAGTRAVGFPRPRWRRCQVRQEQPEIFVRHCRQSMWTHGTALEQIRQQFSEVVLQLDTRRPNWAILTCSSVASIPILDSTLSCVKVPI